MTPLLMSILTMSITTAYSSRGPVDFDVLGKRHVVVGLPIGVSRIGEDVAGGIEDHLAGQLQIQRSNQMVRIKLQLPVAVLAGRRAGCRRRCPRR